MVSSQPQSGGIERRQHPRIKKNYIIRFHDKSNPTIKFDVSQVENISQGGLCFSSTVGFKEGAHVEVELRTPYLTDTIFLEGQILHSREKIKGMIYENRVKFLDVTPRAAEVLTKIEQYNSNQKA